MNELKKRRILWCIIGASVLPLPWIVVVPDWSAAGSVWLYISAISGYMGLALLLWMYILGTRTVIGLYFTDLAAVLSIHKLLGTYGTLLVFLHPVSIGIAYGANILLYTFVPNMSNEFEQHVTYGRIAVYALIVVWVSSALFRGRLAFRPWKYVHYFAYMAMPLALLHTPDVGSSYAILSLPRVYFTSIVLLTLLFTILRFREYLGYGKVGYEVAQSQEVSGGAWLLVLQPQGRQLTPRTGQYVYLQLRRFGEAHPFTVLRANKRTGELTVAYKIVGRWTNALTKLEPASTIWVDGPYGTLDSSPYLGMPSVFLAGGIGVTPFVDQLLRPNIAHEQWLFYANQKSETAVFARQLKAALGPMYVGIFSRESARSDGLGDERGHLTAEILERYLGRPKKYRYYICGSAGFMASAQEELRKLDIPSHNIQAETFGW